MTSNSNARDSDDNSLTIDTGSLDRVPGTTMHVERTATLPETIGVEMIGLPVGTEVGLDLDLSCVEEGVLVTGVVRGVADFECSRCLGRLTAPVSVDLGEMYAYPGTAAAAGVEEDEVRLTAGDVVDLFPSLVDGFGLEFPLNPTCEEFGEAGCVNPATPAPDGVSGETLPRIDPRFVELAERFGLDPDSASAPGPADGEGAE